MSELFGNEIKALGRGLARTMVRRHKAAIRAEDHLGGQPSGVSVR